MAKSRTTYSIMVVSIIVAAALFAGGCKKDDTVVNGGGTNIVPITANLFPVVPGNKYTFVGYARMPRPLSGGGGAVVPDPTSSYRTIWTVGPSVPSPLGGVATALIDTTRGPFGPSGAVVTVSRVLMVKKDSASGDIYFLQTIGPFKRAFGIPVGTNASDTLIWVAVARPSQGMGTTGAQWTAYDSSFTGASATIRLQIVGKIVEQTTIVDSSAGHVSRTVYRSRTARNVTVGGTLAQSDAETSQLWLEAGVGPIQVWIIEDTENLGHYRVLSDKNFPG
jgi:hypothetical protein